MFGPYIPSSSGKNPLSFDVSSFDPSRVGLVTPDEDDDGSTETAIEAGRVGEEEDGWWWL